MTGEMLVQRNQGLPSGGLWCAHVRVCICANLQHQCCHRVAGQKPCSDILQKGVKDMGSRVLVSGL